MRTYKQQLNYEELELISPRQPESSAPKLTLLSVLKDIGRYLLSALTKESGLRIWLSQDRFGNIWWNVYDPKTGESVQRDSEQEILIWLEERYYRH